MLRGQCLNVDTEILGKIFVLNNLEWNNYCKRKLTADSLNVDSKDSQNKTSYFDQILRQILHTTK